MTSVISDIILSGKLLAYHCPMRRRETEYAGARGVLTLQLLASKSDRLCSMYFETYCR